MLTFDAESHTYRWNGRPVPNVTRILAPWCDFSMIPPDVLERARQQGVVIHKMVEAICNGLDHTYAWPDWVKGHRDGFFRFLEQTGFECWASEKRLYHPMGYAGTADLFGLLPKLKDIKGPANIDVKRSFYGGPIIGLQTAGYTEAWNKEAPKDLRVPQQNRFALRLDANGTFRLQRYEDPDDWIDFCAALRQLRFREKHYVSRTTATA